MGISSSCTEIHHISTSTHTVKNDCWWQQWHGAQIRGMHTDLPDFMSSVTNQTWYSFQGSLTSHLRLPRQPWPSCSDARSVWPHWCSWYNRYRKHGTFSKTSWTHTGPLTALSNHTVDNDIGKHMHLHEWPGCSPFRTILITSHRWLSRVLQFLLRQSVSWYSERITQLNELSGGYLEWTLGSRHT